MNRPILAFASIAATLASPGAAHPLARPTRPEWTITREEAFQRADRLFEMLDVNHDGVLTRREAEMAGAALRAERAETGIDVAPGIGAHTARYFEHRFAGARVITREQFEQAMLDHFDQLDRDHDGVLTAKERGEARSERR